MLKNSKSFIITTFICSIFSAIKTEGWTEKLINNTHLYANRSNIFSNKIVPGLTCAAKIGQYAYYHKAVLSYQDMPNEIKSWCIKILKEHDISDIDKINFKLAPQGFPFPWITLPNNTIAIHPVYANQLAQALQGQFCKDDNFFILTNNEFCLLHEINHLICKDVLCQACALPIFLAANALALEKINPFIDKLLNLEKINNLPQSLLKFFMITLSSNLGSYLTMSLYGRYLKSHENKADKFAISKFNDIEKIETVSSFFKQCHNDELALLTIDSFDSIVEKVKQINPLSVPYFTMAYKTIKFFYEKTKKSDETFKSWLETHPKALEEIHFTYAPSHPLSLNRVKQFEARKAELLKEQKTEIIEPELKTKNNSDQAQIGG